MRQGRDPWRDLPGVEGQMGQEGKWGGGTEGAGGETETGWVQEGKRGGFRRGRGESQKRMATYS